ncbi:MAG: elongation factor Ts [Chitinophagaceae bacterium]|nr:elongation factor Ts [Chitinophagaceae bacterium]MCB9044715.1 elongation factor Ts [Chitinophagales bacterium]
MSVTISASDVNKLRQQTGAGMMDCRKALMESDGDFEKAIDYLRLHGQKVAAKREDREAKEGVVIAKTNADNTKGVLVNLSAETDFVSKNQDFIDFAQSLADIALAGDINTIDELKAANMDGATVADKLLEVVAKIGEKIDIVKYEVMTATAVVAYIHSGYRIGVLVSMNKAANEAITEAGRDAAMQIAAMNPLAVNAEGISQETIDREKALAIEQIKAEGKPADMAEKIAMGKLNKFFKDNTLLDQPFVKDSGVTVGAYLNSVDKGLTVTAFNRIAVG